MKIKTIIAAMALIMTVSSCDTVRQAAGSAYNMVNCKYDYNSVSALSVAGINLSKGIQFTDIPRVTSLLSGNASSVPLNMTLNLDVSNPNETRAAMSGLQYILSIDGIQFTTGSVDKPLSIEPGQKQMLPVQIGFDLAGMLRGESADAVMGIAKNFLGIGDKKSEVSLQVKPSFDVAGHKVTSPIYIPVTFSFGGKK